MAGKSQHGSQRDVISEDLRNDLRAWPSTRDDEISHAMGNAEAQQHDARIKREEKESRGLSRILSRASAAA